MSRSFSTGLPSATASLGTKRSPIPPGELDTTAIFAEGSVRKRVPPATLSFASPGNPKTPRKRVSGTGGKVPGSVAGALARLRVDSSPDDGTSAELLRLRKQLAESRAVKSEPPPDPVLDEAAISAREIARLKEQLEIYELRQQLQVFQQGETGRTEKRLAAFDREREDGRPLLTQDAEDKVGELLGKTSHRVRNPLHETFSILDPSRQVSDRDLADFGREKLAKEFSATGKADFKKAMSSWESAFRYFTSKGHFAKGPHRDAFIHLWLQMCSIASAPDNGWKVAAQYFDIHSKYYLSVADTVPLEKAFGLDSWDGRSDLMRNVDASSLDAARGAVRSAKGRSGGGDFKGRKHPGDEYTVYCSHHKLYYTPAMEHSSDNCRNKDKGKGPSGKP